MKTPNVNVKDILNLVKKLGFLKNNLALLVPILIAIVAILLFIPTTLLSSRLRNKIDKESVQMSRQIDSLVQDVNQAAEAEALEPYINAYAQDANAMDNAILQSTLRELLDYKVFVDPNTQTSQLIFDPFRQKYVAGVEAMLKRLNAGGPPSDAEIDAALASSPSRSQYGRNRPGAARSTAGGAYGGMRRNFRMMPEADRKLVEMICQDKAKAAKVYVNPVDLGGYVYWSDWKFEDWTKATKDAWYWQMAFWMLEDVITTVEQMNKDSANILDAPVKRITSVSFTQSRMGRSVIGRGRRSTAPKDKQTPMYVTGVKNAMTGTPCTGRLSSSAADAVMDVMHFELNVVVNAAEIMHFMQELCSAKTHKFRGWLGDQPEQTYKHNQITILESSITPVDREDYDHSSYQYGEDEVVAMNLICEYVFYVPAYLKMQPKVVGEDIAGGGQQTP